MSIYIKEFEEHISEAFCKELIHFYENRDSEPTDITFWKDENPPQDLQDICKKLENSLAPCIIEYFNSFHGLSDQKDLYLDSFLISKHGESFFDDIHYDTPLYLRGDRTGFRPFVCMIYLNDKEFSGGQVIFPSQKYVLEPKEGKVVLFPTTFQFPHMVSSITGGNRYSIRVTFNSTAKKLEFD